MTRTSRRKKPTVKASKKAQPTKLIPKELSWLSFNERVLQESEDPDNPLLERVKFLGIFSNNLDEFYRVRVANLLRVEREGRAPRPALAAKDNRSML